MREVIDFCQEQPEIRSWLDYFDDPCEEEVLTAAAGEDGGGADGGVDDGDIRRQVSITLQVHAHMDRLNKQTAQAAVASS